MDSTKRILIMNNVIRANNAILDYKIELSNVRRNIINLHKNNTLDLEKTFQVENINKTIKNIIISRLKEKEDKLTKDIKKLKIYIKIRLTLLIGISKVDGKKIKYKFFGESFVERDGKIILKRKTLSKGSPIDFFSTHDLNEGYVLLNEIVIQHREIKEIQTYRFDIRTGTTVLIDSSNYTKSYKEYQYYLPKAINLQPS